MRINNNSFRNNYLSKTFETLSRCKSTILNKNF